MPSSPLKILFIINPSSGKKNSLDWEPVIEEYFKELPHEIKLYQLEKDAEATIKKIISEYQPDRVVAAGGDGTVSLVGKILQNTGIPMGILRGGSANGMATELAIPTDNKAALDVIVSGVIQNCDAIRINDDDFCFHLSDAGMNAQLIKYFDESNFRGMWNYARMLGKAFINRSLMKVHIDADGINQTMHAYMVVIANASKYGTGAVINPEGIIDDGKFELVIVRKIALSEFIKLFWSYKEFNPAKVEIFTTTKVEIRAKRKVHFQVDGEYKGKLKNIKATVIPAAIRLLVTELMDEKK